MTGHSSPHATRPAGTVLDCNSFDLTRRVRDEPTQSKQRLSQRLTNDIRPDTLARTRVFDRPDSLMIANRMATNSRDRRARQDSNMHSRPELGSRAPPPRRRQSLHQARGLRPSKVCVARKTAIRRIGPSQEGIIQPTGAKVPNSGLGFTKWMSSNDIRHTAHFT